MSDDQNPVSPESLGYSPGTIGFRVAAPPPREARLINSVCAWLVTAESAHPLDVSLAGLRAILTDYVEPKR
jgi:hypothetical protein